MEKEILSIYCAACPIKGPIKPPSWFARITVTPFYRRAAAVAQYADDFLELSFGRIIRFHAHTIRCLPLCIYRELKKKCNFLTS